MMLILIQNRHFILYKTEKKLRRAKMTKYGFKYKIYTYWLRLENKIETFIWVCLWLNVNLCCKYQYGYNILQLL